MAIEIDCKGVNLGARGSELGVVKFSDELMCCREGW